LPTGGGELLLFGRPVEQIVAGDDTGSVLYALAGTRLARSPDGGVSWFAQGPAVPGRLTPALNDPDVVYAGDLGSCAISVLATPLSASTNGGRDWIEMDGAAGIMPLLVDAEEPTVIVGSNCTLQLSYDGGATWKFVPTTSNYDVRVAASRTRSLAGEIAVVGTSEGGTGTLWKFDLSTPGTVVDGGVLATFWGAAGLTWAQERMVLATATGVGVSDDGGVTWSWSRLGLEDATYSVDPLTTDIPSSETGKTVGFQLAAIDPNDFHHLWVAGTAGLFTSSDDGATWARLGSISKVDSLALSDASNRVFASADGHTYVWALNGQ
jgi:hypothetical protein